MWPGEFMESFSKEKSLIGAFLEVMKKKIVLIPFNVPLNEQLLSIHHAESILQHHRKAQTS